MNEAAKEAAKFLKSTLRLPSSTFPPRPPPADIQRLLPRCTDNLYAWQRQTRPARDTFVLHDGPPYANGDLHVGHALNKIIKDIICRSKLAEGRRVDYVPGWDCHGLPIELKALEKHGWKRGQGVDAVSIRQAARSFAHNTVRKQMKEFRSWGVMGDWNNHWKTMDRDFELRQLTVFKALTERGLIYRRHKPVFWSPSSRTALAEAEVEYQDDYVSTSAIVKFPTNIRRPGSDEPIHAVIWTTTPWTLPANQAIAINDGIQYCLVRSEQHGLLLVAFSRLQYLEEHTGEKVQVVEEVFPVYRIAGTTYSGLSEFGPDAKDRPIIHADFVTDLSGTGLVHCAPGHGEDDFEALQPLIEAGLVQVKAPVDHGGNFTTSAAPENPSLLAGLYVYKEGNQAVLDLMKQNNTLISSFKFKHKYTIDWRTKEPVMIRATAQWFADVSSIRDATLSSLDSVQFKPDSGKSRLRSFITNRSEWCISRQRAWGVPIPALYHRVSGEAILTPQSIDHIISVIEQRGIDAWWSDATDDPAWIPDGLSPAEYERGTDTMDVWFDSGTSWMFMLKDHVIPTEALADVYLEGSDQHRGWFQSSLLTSIAYQKAVSTDSTAHAPFKKLVTHGFTLDANEKKMSKSEGNVIAPDEIIAGLTSSSKAVQPKTSKKHRQVHPLGPDALRLWAASSEWTRDVAISERIVTSVHHNLDKYRVTVKLLLGMLQDFNPDKEVAYEDMSQLDQIALCHLYETAASVRQSLADFEFHKVINSVNRWITTDLSSFYFEAVKDVIYCGSVSSLRRQSAQTTLYHIFIQLQHMLGPITPVLIEESFEHTSEVMRQASQHPLQRVWSSCPSQWHNKEFKDAMPLIMSVNTAVKAAQERARADKVMGQSLGSEVLVYLKQPHQHFDLVSNSTFEEILVVSRFDNLPPRLGDETVRILDRLENQSDEIDKLSTRHELVRTITNTNWAFAHEIQNVDGKVAGFVVVQAPTLNKCARCWKYNVPAEEVKEPMLCVRCDEVVAEYK